MGLPGNCLLLALILILEHSKSLSWRHTSTETLYDVIFIRNLTKKSIINTTFPADSSGFCAISCSREQGESFCFDSFNFRCYCNSLEDESVIEDDTATTFSYGTIARRVQKYAQDSNVKLVTHGVDRQDCLSLYQAGYRKDCVYTIEPTADNPHDVFCDMSSGGWTVIQRRQDGSEDFYRNWNDYVNGFGSEAGEYWLGLENIHIMTQENSELFINIEAFEGTTTKTSYYAHYQTMIVYGASDNYRLNISGFSGDTGDSMATHNGMTFSTFDKDTDQTGEHCADTYHGGWWYNACHSANLNGVYNETAYGLGINWWYITDHNVSLKATTMKIRRVLLPEV